MAIHNTFYKVKVISRKTLGANTNQPIQPMKRETNEQTKKSSEENMLTQKATHRNDGNNEKNTRRKLKGNSKRKKNVATK